MRQMMPNTTTEGNLHFWDLLAAEKRLVVFIENIYRRPGHRGWWLSFSQAVRSNVGQAHYSGKTQSGV